MGRARRGVARGGRTAWVGMACPGPGCRRRTALRFECGLRGAAHYGLAVAQVDDRKGEIGKASSRSDQLIYLLDLKRPDTDDIAGKPRLDFMKRNPITLKSFLHKPVNHLVINEIL